MNTTDLPLPDLDVPGGDLAFVLGVLFNQRVRAELAWSAPGRLADRHGGLDVATLADADPARLQEMMRRPPAVHPFAATMAARVIGVCARLQAEHGGRAAALWDDHPSAEVLAQRLTTLPGIGVHKANVAVALLRDHYGLPLADGGSFTARALAACPRLRQVLMT
ncbi:Fe-S cluster assembly protein HesB [Actinomadura rubrisoli]|uniref:Fe-S cluster assembly protein HesB n=1 Tax=Actinomadura rubrisoli TaxID=2530368 RepID=A0A4R5AQU2_9ACTN|nr:Fe-S cluster assembly protein HesB [Actinomadura rubrisoli]TDD75063.1 Fe-S cluster assembly protein HesB [Actinomadura rubrisoli]